jgi:hypothetical protein
VIVRPVALAVGLALLVAGCGGGGGSSRRDAVASYLDQVNRIEAGLTRPAASVAVATHELTTPHGDRTVAEHDLRSAARRIDALRRRLARVDTPAEALKLRALLLEQLDREAGLAREVAAYAAFMPAFETALHPLAPAGSRLQHSLSTKRPPAEDAAALDAYDRTLAVVVGRLRALRPPPVSAPVRTTELRTLERVRAAATALAKALRAKRASAVPGLVHDLEVAGAGNASIASQRARIAAIRAYNRRVDSLATLTARIDRERARVASSLA